MAGPGGDSIVGVPPTSPSAASSPTEDEPDAGLGANSTAGTVRTAVPAASPPNQSRVSIVHISPADNTGSPRRTSRRGEFINLCMNVSRDIAAQSSSPFVLHGRSAVAADEDAGERVQGLWRSEDSETVRADGRDGRKRAQRSLSLSSSSNTLGDLRPTASPDQLATIRRLVRETLAQGAANPPAPDAESVEPVLSSAGSPVKKDGSQRGRSAVGTARPAPLPTSSSHRAAVGQRQQRRQSDNGLSVPVLPPIGQMTAPPPAPAPPGASAGTAQDLSGQLIVGALVRDRENSAGSGKDSGEGNDADVDHESDGAIGAALLDMCRPEIYRLIQRTRTELKGDRTWMAVIIRVLKAGEDARVLDSVAAVIYRLCDQEKLMDAFIHAGVPRLLLMLVRERCTVGGYGTQDQKLFPWLANSFKIVTRLTKRDATLGRWLRKCGTLSVAIDVLKRHVHSDGSELIGPAISICCALAGTESHGSLLLQADIIPVVLEAMRRRPSGAAGQAIMAESLQLFSRLAGGSRANLLAFVMKSNMAALLATLDDALQSPAPSPAQMSILDILLNAASIEEGRRAFLDGGGLRRVYDAAARLEGIDAMAAVVDAMADVLRCAAPAFELPIDFDAVEGLIRESESTLGLQESAESAGITASLSAGDGDFAELALSSTYQTHSMPALPTGGFPAAAEDFSLGPVDLFPEMRSRSSSREGTRERDRDPAGMEDADEDGVTCAGGSGSAPGRADDDGSGDDGGLLRRQHFRTVPGLAPDLLLECGLTAAVESRLKQRGNLERKLILGEMRRLAYPETCAYDVVYDVDSGSAGSSVEHALCVGSLVFESRFESGNLHRAIMINPLEYDLILSPDLSSAASHNCQWFFFRVSNIRAGCRYVFRVVNMEKPTSQFNEGMQPVVLSTLEHETVGTGWRRLGSDVCYYRNWYTTDRESTSRKRTPPVFFTLAFSLQFDYDGDVAYVAYHYPYTYSALQSRISQLQRLPTASRYLMRNTLCTTLGGVACDLLTITDFGDDPPVPPPVPLSQITHSFVPPSTSAHPDTPRSRDMVAHGRVSLKRRQYVLLTARVHPGESNASWIMDGLVTFLLGGSDEAQQLLGRYIFKIVPMLNPDGVILGCNRYSMAGVDLNRQWTKPGRTVHPTIFRTKAMARFLVGLGRPPFLYCDIHGHSRKKNVFLYGCGGDRYTVEAEFPRMLANTSPAFSIDDSSFVIKRDKESTARVVMWRQFRIPRSYTLESSFCGSDRGELAGTQFAPKNLRDVGRDFCMALIKLNNGPKPGFGGTIFGY
eukprot:Opistho-2@55921